MSEQARHAEARSEEVWYDEAAGPVVRPYAVTRGRTRAARDLDLVTLIVTTAEGSRPEHALPPEHREMLRLCRAPLSVAEAAVSAGLPIGTARVVLGDLAGAGLVRSCAPPTAGPTEKTLNALLTGLRAL